MGWALVFISLASLIAVLLVAIFLRPRATNLDLHKLYKYDPVLTKAERTKHKNLAIGYLRKETGKKTTIPQWLPLVRIKKGKATQSQRLIDLTRIRQLEKTMGKLIKMTKSLTSPTQKIIEVKFMRDQMVSEYDSYYFKEAKGRVHKLYQEILDCL